MTRCRRTVLLLSLAFGLVACGGEADEGVPEPTLATAAERTTGPDEATDIATVLDEIAVAEDDPPSGTQYFQSFDGTSAARR